MVERRGKLLRPHGVGRGQQFVGGLSGVQPAGRIQTRPEGEADRLGVDLAGHHPRSLHQRGHAQPSAPVDQVEPGSDQGPVLALERDHIGDRPDRDKVEQGAFLEGRTFAPGARLAQQALGQPKGDPDPGQSVKRIRATSFRVHHRQRVGDRLALQFVVIGDDEIQPDRAGPGGLAHGPDAAVDGDDELRAFRCQGFQRLRIQTVAFLKAVGDVDPKRRAQGGQGVMHQGAGRDPVAVVVAIHHDGLAGLNGGQDSGHGYAQILQSEDVNGPGGPGGIEKGLGLLERAHPARVHRLRGKRVDARRLERIDEFPRRARRDYPVRH